MEFRYAYSLESANHIRVTVPKGVNWTKMKNDGLKNQYGAIILSQLVHRLNSEGSSLSDYMTLSSEVLEVIHRQYRKFLDWFINEGVLQVKRNLKGGESYRASGKGLHFSKSYRFSPAFIENSGGWHDVIISDRRALRAFRNLISFWSENEYNSNVNTETENIKDNNTIIIENTDTNNLPSYMFSVSAELIEQKAQVLAKVDIDIPQAPATQAPAEVDDIESEFFAVFGV